MNNNVPRLDRHLWRACAGRTVKIPAEGSTVYYFPQGHAENANCAADFAAVALGLPPLILCRVEAVNLMADSETDEVFAAMTLRLVGSDSIEDYAGDDNPEEDSWTGASFAKVLTQSDANNGGGFSVPRHCADTVFPALNYAADPPVQELLARDVHGEVWKFRHIYRGTPRRHLLTSGWSVFVNRKRLVARDSIVFLRSDSGEICVGTRRARRTAAAQGRVRAEEFAEAVTRAARGEAFEAVFYPRDGAAEFCVRAAEVRAALADPWRSGLRLKMEVEDETTSRVKNCNGITTAVKAFDPVHWPNSPWRILQVSWDDEPDKQHNPQCVSPWMIDAVPNMMMCPPFPPDEPPRKKFRPEHYQDYIFSGKFSVPPGTILGDSHGPINPSGYQYNTNPVGIQGARHLVLEVPLPEYFSDNRVRRDLFHSRAAPAPPPEKLSFDPDSVVAGPFCSNGDLSCLLSLQQTSPNSGEWPGGTKNHVVSLFGQVLGVFQIDSSDVEVSKIERKSPLYENGGAERDGCDSVKIGRCKVFKEFADVGWTIDLSVIGSYEELYKSLSNEFKIEISAMMTRVLYHDATGAPKHTGDLPFNEFMKVAKRLTIIADPEKDKDVKRSD